MQAENADSAGLNRFQIWPATLARSAAHAQYARLYIYLYIYIYIYRDSASVESTRGGSLTLAPIRVLLSACTLYLACRLAMEGRTKRTQTPVDYRALVNFKLPKVNKKSLPKTSDSDHPHR